MPIACSLLPTPYSLLPKIEDFILKLIENCCNETNPLSNHNRSTRQPP
ncbi:MAG: hypothetical protein F6J94_18845 [Moorea sp. SIO1F2]|nr:MULTISPECIES: hypothetical protein [unclassified Moorena]NEN94929.1 hypothetical protein [Moorena sp. SIO3I7]NEO06740.1 hypothetical protein [Moorena sp. SIO3I8]NEO20941.1 hypothetical protein [Moorena sp. SIO4A5]NEP21709.1 hypothetical protein [Moorena sp. SIO3I6]NEQ61024.1 hypothetical protein [Moorena sp. SIO4A1]